MWKCRQSVKCFSGSQIPIALVVHHRIDYLLTWNCKHIANARMLPKLHQALKDLGCWIPIICTLEEMLDDDAY